MDRIRNVAVFGMGALGSALARRMSQADDVHVYGIVRALEAYWGAPIVVDGQTLRVNYRDIGTMADVPIDLILLCVRSYDFREAAELIRPLVGEETILLPLTSGLGRAEQLARLFDRFYRTDSSRNSGTGGYGIGLSIAQAIVSAHKGKISAETSDGHSLTVTALFPSK